MQKITSLLKNLKNNPRLKGVSFTEGDDFWWDHTTRTVYYNARASQAARYLLHEAGHAALNHQKYPDDITLITMERAAWDEAIAIGSEFGISLPNDFAEDALDSYRDWLHARSHCPACASTGVQTSSYTYECIACHHKWKVNEAKNCALRRFRI